MEPIVPIVEITKPTPSTARGTLADLIASILAALAAVMAFGYSALFFSRFLENDTHLWGVASAFLLCFGVGAFGYIPAAIISFIARRSHKNGAHKKPLLWALIVLIPWLILALILTFVSDMPKIYSIPTLITVLLLTAWVLISLRKSKVQ